MTWPCDSKIKKYQPNCGICRSGYSRGKTEGKREEGWVPKPCLRIEKNNVWNMKVTVLPIVMLSSIQSLKDWYKTGGHGNERTSGDHPNYTIVEIGQNTKKNSGDLKRRAVPCGKPLSKPGMKNSQVSKITILF